MKIVFEVSNLVEKEQSFLWPNLAFLTKTIYIYIIDMIETSLSSLHLLSFNLLYVIIYLLTCHHFFTSCAPDIFFFGGGGELKSGTTVSTVPV